MSKGYIYRKGRIKVTVSKVFKQGTGESLEAISNSHLVEMSVLATSGSNQVHFPFCFVSILKVDYDYIF